MTLTSSFIDGRLAASAATYENIDPATGATLGEVGRSGADEVDRAVAAARAARRSWRSTAPEHRADILERLAGLIARDADLLARLETEDCGKPLSQARADAAVCARYFRFYGRVIEAYYGRQIPVRDDLHVYTSREPHGVTGHIVAWNYPMPLLARGVAPAIATGNCAVVKPADETPRTAVRIAELAIEAGLPPGVLNVVTGLGAEAGAALAGHEDVDHLGFVGSTHIGSLVAAAAARRVSPATLELGGKSAHVVFPDADIVRASSVAAAAILQNAGQTCSAGSRVLVHERVHAEVVERIAAAFAAVRIGPGIDDPDLGPLVSHKQLQRVKAHVDGVTHGTVVTGGTVVEPPGVTGGAFYAPTLVDGADPTSAIAQEEIFGPVMVVMPFADEDEGLALANGTKYGLAGAVWTSDLACAHRVARGMEAALVYVNAYGAGAAAEIPFGGIRRSGYGRERGIEALDAYTATKSVVVQV